MVSPTAHEEELNEPRVVVMFWATTALTDNCNKNDIKN
jgi:hypothetical protein